MTGALPSDAPSGGPVGVLAEPIRRVLVVHNRYQMRGGEDAVVEREIAALRGAGQIVETLFVTNDAIRTPLDRLEVALRVADAKRGVALVRAAAERFRPDIVHCHNTFPLISPAVHGAVRATGAATVQTLHNFRVTCANAQLMRDGSPCENCVTGSPYNAVRHGCYRGSRLGSLAVAHMIDRHRRAGTWTSAVDRLIALTRFAKGRFMRAGLPAHKIVVKPNGLPDPGAGPALPRSGVLFVGRLSPEKGIAVLAAAASLTRGPIAVIGDGPLGDTLRGVPGLVPLGTLPPAAVVSAMASAVALIVPSLWYEGLPMVVAEAFAAGTPVIASGLGGLAEIVEHGVTGLHVRPGDPADLARACDWMLDHPDEARRMGRAARAAFDRHWSETVTTQALLNIYGEAVAARHTLGHAS